MGCGKSKADAGLSKKLRNKALELFATMDTDKSKEIDRDETKKFWKSNFAKVNTESLFKCVDFDNGGTISEDEWLAYWTMVKKAGHTE